MDQESPTALHKRLVELLRASGHSTLRISQVAAILGIDDDDSQYTVLRELLARSRIVDYDAQRQTIRSMLPEHGERAEEEDDDEAALLAMSDGDAIGHHHGRGTGAHTRQHQRRSNSRGYRSDTGLPAPGGTNRSFSALTRRRTPGGGWSKPGQRALDDATSYPGPAGRVGYVCVADELHLGKLESYYRAQGYYTKFDFDVLHVRFAQPASAASVKVEAAAGAAAGGARDRGRDARLAGTHRGSDTSLPASHSPDSATPREGRPHTRDSDDAAGAAAESLPAMRTAADVNPRYRDYGSTCGMKAGSAAGGAGGSGSGEGGEAPGAAGSSSSAGVNASSASVKQGFELFIFPYGAVVWWGFDQRYFKIVESDYMLPHSAISHCMTNRYTTQLVNENYPVWCTYNLVRRDTLEVDAQFKERLRFDHFVIPYSRGEVATGSVLMLCASHALAQSAKIDYIELQVQGLADSCSPLPRELREKGTVSITERRLLQLRGEVLSYRLMLKSGSDLLDEPDFFWENAYLKPVFQATKEEFEIAERVEALDNKLDAANEILSMLAEDFSQRHGARLEWIVIWLVFVEVVIGVLELLVDVRPWIRSK